MARGEYAGYDIRPAEAALVQALRNPDSAALALETLGRLPGSENQHRLAGLVLDEAARASCVCRPPASWCATSRNTACCWTANTPMI